MLEGTISPADILALMSSARSDPDFRSARRRSPADRWDHPNFSERRAHCVPFPAPGPPRTKTTWNFASLVVLLVMLCFRSFAANAVAVDANRNRENGQILGIVSTVDDCLIESVRNNDGVFR